VRLPSRKVSIAKAALIMAMRRAWSAAVAMRKWRVEFESLFMLMIFRKYGNGGKHAPQRRSVLAAILHFACSTLEDAALSQNLHDVLVGEI